MAIAFVQSKSVSTSGATSITTAAITTTSGNNIITGFAASTNLLATSTPISDSKSNTWLSGFKDNNSPSSGSFYAENITGGASHTFTLTPDSSVGCTLGVLEFSGLKNSSSIDKHTSSNTTGNPHSSGATVAISQANELLVGVGSSTTNTSVDLNAPASTLFFVDTVSFGDSSPEGLIFTYGIASAIDTFLYSWWTPEVSSTAECGGIATFKGSAPAFVQSKSANSGGATSITTPSFTSTAGNFLGTIVTAFSRTLSGSPVSDNNSSTYQSAFVNNTGRHTASYYAENITGRAGHTVTFTPTGGSDACGLGVGEFSGINTSSSIDQTAVGNGTTAIYSTARTTATAQAKELIIGGGGQSNLAAAPVSGGFAPATSSGWTDAVSIATPASSNTGLIVSYQIVNAVAAYTFYFRNYVSGVDNTGIVTFKGLGSGGPGQGANPGRGGGKKGGPGSSNQLFGPTLSVNWSDYNLFGGN